MKTITSVESDEHDVERHMLVNDSEDDGFVLGVVREGGVGRDEDEVEALRHSEHGVPRVVLVIGRPHQLHVPARQEPRPLHTVPRQSQYNNALLILETKKQSLDQVNR